MWFDQEVHILLVEDEPRLATAVRRAFQEEGHVVDWVGDGDGAVAQARTEDYDVLVLDVMLPGSDGFSVARTLRGDGATVPILMLTARGDDTDRIVGLELGADDYLPKPFEPRELVARIHNILRRSSDDSGMRDIKKIVGLDVDMSRREVKLDGEVLDLTTMEYELLILFMQFPNKTFTRDELMNRLRGIDAECTGRPGLRASHRRRS